MLEIQNALLKAADGYDLSLEETRGVMDTIMSGQATDAQIASFITAMRMKGETVEEITACALVLRDKCQRLEPQQDVLDIVGTGGDRANTFNISTTSAFVIASAGVPVAKHGNRSVSSKCGAADCLEALGARLDVPRQRSEAILQELGFCFLFAPLYHSSMKYAGPVRKQLGLRTLFNIIGPLTNPAGATMQLLGVYDENLVEPMAKVLANLGVKRAMVVHGHDGLDEATLTTSSTLCELIDGRMNSFFLDPAQLGLKRCQKEDLVGGSPAENAQLTLDILSGRDRGPKRDAVLLNSALCIYLGKGQKVLRDCLAEAADIIDSGKALAKLQRFVELTQA
ncbi:anthranilate phosphoribosyltransferase [Acidaminococcus sp. NSJ-142]|jgi:anthranilate phosphoribosyltransferase|uniref:anthranilate phosphoribosyltransferase n=1 Tax=Acidaminococcus TaxID=904 RepID=UPI000CF8D824|nr:MULTISPECIES: anthranilate phosphoribosyltransferase [Acidaminococcus]MCD2436194.1 anthranilate phosphoribosyltransferase [Acidaminococcus hominis]MCH4097041.1 anthranilate phosphoribosyltransferase [Acidaminococcus provencensis]RHK01701.1 anthranilate phosphoribosyltransferase [Acidaminococcus sp. AM05-11]